MLHDAPSTEFHIKGNLTAPLCEKWHDLTQASIQYVISSLVSTMIVIMNFSVRLLFMTLASHVGFSNESVKASFITFGVFYTTFFQTGLLCVIASLDLREKRAGFFNELFSGVYTDLNAGWFKDIGYIIVYNCCFNAIWPIIEFFMWYSIRHVRRMHDQKKFWPNDVTRTRTSTMFGFLAIYDGPIFLVHFKYAFILNVVFVTFFYGSILPILFPIAWLSIFVLYSVERLSIFYSYQRPPMYDDTLTRSAITTMYAAPVVCLLMGAWAFSN